MLFLDLTDLIQVVNVLQKVVDDSILLLFDRVLFRLTGFGELGLNPDGTDPMVLIFLFGAFDFDLSLRAGAIVFRVIWFFHSRFVIFVAKVRHSLHVENDLVEEILLIDSWSLDNQVDRAFWT